MFNLLKFFKRKLSPTAQLGKMGEDAAVKFLKSKRKMKIVSRNTRIGKLEVDIIARDSDCLVFVEVKNRVHTAQVDGYYAAVSKKKIDNLKRFARAYISLMKQKPSTWRFDAIDVRHNGKEILSVKHFENIG